LHAFKKLMKGSIHKIASAIYLKLARLVILFY
jgi:hypothetical protein